VGRRLERQHVERLRPVLHAPERHVGHGNFRRRRRPPSSIVADRRSVVDSVCVVELWQHYDRSRRHDVLWRAEPYVAVHPCGRYVRRRLGVVDDRAQSSVDGRRGRRGGEWQLEYDVHVLWHDAIGMRGPAGACAGGHSGHDLLQPAVG
jgi:hypothetical protein